MPFRRFRADRLPCGRVQRERVRAEDFGADEFSAAGGARHDLASQGLIDSAVAYATEAGFYSPAMGPVVCVLGKSGIDADEGPLMRVQRQSDA